MESTTANMSSVEFLEYVQAKLLADVDLTIDENLRLTQEATSTLSDTVEKLKIEVEALRDVSESFAEILSVKNPELLAEVQTEYRQRQEKRFLESLFGADFVAGLVADDE
ncbi:hypothetical protein KIJ60_gp18 [Rhodococcus phage PhailMary]|uniref:Uncharacterized protein n=1 Tax=Rhodococcus phage PhailMary TaxID=2793705 RepID=A0A7T0M372_9CAUD|nr:hypothetical protein KIJ60_gp18 [Rhodococcus phage PhailMary]QPL15206.1 hypothetical protein SEA_PHAILMARY_51 [Rhodococcus phage PhailMary]